MIPRPGTSKRDRDRTGLTLHMRVSDFGGIPGLYNELLDVVGKIGAERRHTHRASIAHRAHAGESLAGGLLPWDTGSDVAKDRMRCSAVPPYRLARIFPCKQGRKV